MTSNSTSDTSTAAALGKPDAPKNDIKIAVFVCFVNAGMSTTGIEIAKALRKLDSDLNICLFSWKAPPSISYEHLAQDFDIRYYGNEIDLDTWTEMLKAEHSGGGGLMQNKDWIKTNIQGALQALKDYMPTVVVHGAIPTEAAVASAILNIPSFSHGPIPMWNMEWMEEVICRDIPDAQSTWWTDLLPLGWRQSLMHYMFRQRRKNTKSATTEAAKECGWTPTDEYSSTMTSDYYIVRDLPSNYNGFDFGSNVKIVGPVYAVADESGPMEDDVQAFLSLDAQRKIFVTMGSTGGKEFFVEAVKAVIDTDLPAFVALIPGRCSTQDVLDSIGVIPDRVTLTERFVPANVIAAHVDVVVAHGGQGTVKTALASGTPIVGVAMQWEQQFHLDNAAKKGAGIRIDKRKWKSAVIKEAIERVLGDTSYRQAALTMKEELEHTHGADSAAEFVLDVARSR